MNMLPVVAAPPDGGWVTFRRVRWPNVCMLAVFLGVSASACSHGAKTASSPTSATATSTPSTGPKNPAARRPGARSTPPTPRPVGNGEVSATPASIASDCSADVTSSLQAWFDSTLDNNVLTFPKDACYRIEDTLRLAQRRDLVIEGNGATLQATTVGAGGRIRVRGRSHLLISQSHNIVLRDLIVRGANPHAGTGAQAYQPAYEAQHAFSLSADDGVTLDRVQAYDVYGDFVYVGGRNGTPSKHITVKDSKFARNGRQGISVTNGEDVDIIDNEIRDVARSLIDLEPNSRRQEARRIRIDGNTTGAVRNFWLANKGSGINIGNVTVSGNTMRAASGGLVFVYGPAFGKRGPYVFTDNQFQVTGVVTDEDATGVFVFRNAQGIEISKNTVRAPVLRRMPAVELRGSSDVVVAGNRFTGTAEPVKADAASSNVHVAP
jgi:Right handed beta helix region